MKLGDKSKQPQDSKTKAYKESFFFKCVAQAGLELVILLPLPSSANTTGMHHHNQ